MIFKTILLGFCALLLINSSAYAEPAPQVFALVIGHNQSLDPTVKPLKYADDDAVRFYELIGSFASRFSLLTILDPETQRLNPSLASISRPPSYGELVLAMDQIVDAIKKARQAGAKTVFYFYFAGHGDVGNDREGYINLLDRRFSRSDLFREIIGRSPANVNHIIIDACNSYFLVNQRGERGERASHTEAIRSFLTHESLSRYPNTGVVLSTATMAESHEWSRYRSGIFSHQFLSALWGSADVNGDGIVDYQELQAYIAAANLTVRDKRAQLSIFARPPQANLAAELINLRLLQSPNIRPPQALLFNIKAFLTLPTQMKGRFYLEDDRGVRIMDFHKSDEQPLKVALLNRPYFYLRSDDKEARIDLQKPEGSSTITAESLTFTEIPLQSRGSVEQSFRQDLYAIPFGQRFALGYLAGAGEINSDNTIIEADHGWLMAKPWYSRTSTWKWTSAAAAVASLGIGVTYQLLSNKSANELDAGQGQVTMLRAVELQQTSRTRQTVAGISFGIAGATAVSTALLFLLDRGTSQPSAQAGTTLGALPFPGGGAFMLNGNF